MYDYTGKIGPLLSFTGSDWPMYSFSTPAFAFWNGIANGLKAEGYKNKQIKEWLQSKSAKWFMDVHEGKIEELGFSLAKKIKG